MLERLRPPIEVGIRMKTLGIRGVFTHLLRRALTFVPRGTAFRLFLVVLTEPRPTRGAITAASQHTFRFATLDDLERLQKDMSSKIVERDIDSFKGGSLCLLQLDGDKLVGYTWIGNSPLIDLGWGFHANLPDDMVYNYNGYTAPTYRGTAYQALRHLKVLEHVRAAGKYRLLGFVDHLNYKSLQGVAKSGYQRIGVLRGIRRNGNIHFSLTINENDWSTATRAGPLQY